MLGNILVHEACKKQMIVMKNSTESELVALADFLHEVGLVEDFVKELGYLMNDFVTNVHWIYQDNKSAIPVVKHGGGKPCMKYMKVREEYLKERLKTGEVEIEYVKTHDMLANVLTKPLGGELFHTFVNKLLGHRFACLSNKGAKEDMTCTTRYNIQSYWHYRRLLAQTKQNLQVNM